MIKFVFLNWKFKEPGQLYSTEIIEEEKITELIKKLETLKTEYNLESVHPISTIFDAYSEIKLSKIIQFLKESVLNCQVSSDSDMEAYQRLLGPNLRHGPEIFQEISDITDSLLTEGGKYDPVYIIRDFLKNPYDGCSEICRRAIEESCRALADNRRTSMDREQSWCVGDFLKVVGISWDGIDLDILSKKIYVFQDDGMGYGAVNGPCITIENNIDRDTGENQIRIWM